MTAAATPPKPRAFRLRGEPEGVKISAVVKAGTKSIGSSPTSDIVVPVFGVSKKHAVLGIIDGALVVEDTGSKNGVFVNGVRTQRATLSPGDWVQLGPAALRVEEITASDAELGIAIDQTSTGVKVATPADRTADWDAHRPRARERWMPLLSRLSGVLLGQPEPAALSEILADLGEGLGAEGVSLLEWTGERSPVALATWGRLADLNAKTGLPPELAELVRARRATAAVVSATHDGPPPLAWAAASARGIPPRALVVQGEFPHREAAGPLLEVVLRMALHAQPQHLHFPVEAEPVELPELSFPAGYVPGRSRAILGVYEQLGMLVRGDIPLLITGETGVGKEHIARILHASSPRSRGPFVAVNCAAIPSELLEAELFGIEEGVATGVRKRDGKFQHAAGGVILLDEIGDTPLSVQAKLLRALQANEVHPVGARLSQRIDVRVLTATNTDLRARIESGQFRRDLYYRIAGYTLPVPPLRERRADIPLLVEHFMRRSAIEAGKRIQGITVHALRALQNAPWPGNIRELEHEVRRLVYLCPDGQAIDSALLPPEILHPAPHAAPDALPESDIRLAPRVEALERRLVALALARSSGNRSVAASLLGISRQGLAMKCKRLGMRG